MKDAVRRRLNLRTLAVIVTVDLWILLWVPSTWRWPANNGTQTTEGNVGSSIRGFYIFLSVTHCFIKATGILVCLHILKLIL